MLSNILTKITIAAAPENPLNGVTPSIDVFGVQFKGAIQLVMGGLWALALLAVTAAFIWNLAKWGVARKDGRVDDISDGATGAKRSGIAFGCVAGASVLIGALLAVAGAAGA